jgi:hypothetical protein
MTTMPSLSNDSAQDGIVPVLQQVDEKHMNQHIEQADVDDKRDFLREEADRAEDFEHNLSTWASVKMYRVAVFWSIVATMSIIMEGKCLHLNIDPDGLTFHRV